MCDYSLHNVKSRPAKVGDKLTTRNFGLGTRGFAAPEDATTAVCVLPGTEIAFSQAPVCAASGLLGWGAKKIKHAMAIFRGRAITETNFGLGIILIVHTHSEKTAIRGPAGHMSVRETWQGFYLTLPVQ